MMHSARHTEDTVMYEKPVAIILSTMEGVPWQLTEQNERLSEMADVKYAHSNPSLSLTAGGITVGYKSKGQKRT
jgi:hypothetical protein